MKNYLGFECSICDKPLVENERLFTLEMCIEHESGGMYDVGNAEAILTVCEPCSITHNIQDKINRRTIAMIDSARIRKKLQPTKPQKITVIHNRYDCSICDLRIPNNSKILTTSSGYELWDNGSVTPDEAYLHMAACINCSKDMNLETMVKETINGLLTECKKKTIRIVKE